MQMLYTCQYIELDISLLYLIVILRKKNVVSNMIFDNDEELKIVDFLN